MENVTPNKKPEGIVKVQENKRASHISLLKVCLIALISLLLLIPLLMVQGLIHDRKFTRTEVAREVAESYGESQYIGGPVFTVTMEDEKGEHPYDKDLFPSVLDYQAEVATDVLRRSIYDVIVYTSSIDIKGVQTVTADMLKAKSTTLSLRVEDFKGLSAMPQVTFGDNEYTFERKNNRLVAHVWLPEGVQEGGAVDFSLSLNVKGTGSLWFYPLGEQTTLTMHSAYPHPGFKGEFLPEMREVREDGFDATWSVLSMNTNSDNDVMGVEFIQPANPYQQATRSAKYGMLIILLTFVASLFVEFLTRKEINVVQYGIVGLSLVLFYALLLSFSEFIAFGLAYVIAAVMTVSALTLYYRAILKDKSAWIFGGFVVAVYVVNYLLLQMENYSLLVGTLVLFVLLTVVMYLTTNMSGKKKPLPEAAAPSNRPDANDSDK